MLTSNQCSYDTGNQPVQQDVCEGYSTIPMCSWWGLETGTEGYKKIEKKVRLFYITSLGVFELSKFAKERCRR